jgi:cytochrome c peroxidase
MRMPPWNRLRAVIVAGLFLALPFSDSNVPRASADHEPRLLIDLVKGKTLFERETFGGNGRTCLTCHSRETGTVSPEDAQRRFAEDPRDPLFRGDGTDDGQGAGVTRILANATIRMRVPLAENVSLAHDPKARTVVLMRGIPTTLNTPALDPVLMYDGRQPDLPSQARGAIIDHAEARREPTLAELRQIARFQRTPAFFSSLPLVRFAFLGVAPRLPEGRTASERRGRRFFEDLAPSGDFKGGLCAACHSGPMLNETNEFIPAPPFARGGRFQNVGVSELNAAGNPIIDFVFKNPDGTSTVVSSPDPGRALVTGNASDTFQSVNAFKIPSLWGVARTAPYFHDNSARTLEDTMRHYTLFFSIISNGAIVLTEEDQADAIAFMKLLR